MPRVYWPHRNGRPCVEVQLLLPNGRPWTRTLLTDTGAGSLRARFELVLPAADCVQVGAYAGGPVRMRGAYAGLHPTYDLRVQIPALGLDRILRVIGAAPAPPGFDGLAGFLFLNRFTYGNFGNPAEFGLEM